MLNCSQNQCLQPKIVIHKERILYLHSTKATQLPLLWNSLFCFKYVWRNCV